MFCEICFLSSICMHTGMNTHEVCVLLYDITYRNKKIDLDPSFAVQGSPKYENLSFLECQAFGEAGVSV